MLDSKEFARDLHIDPKRLQVFIDRGWISPVTLDKALWFRDIDRARGALIVDLADEMGVNDEGVDVVLDLLDQLYGLRFALSIVIEALEDERQRHPGGHHASPARTPDTRTRNGSRSRRMR